MALQQPKGTPVQPLGIGSGSEDSRPEWRRASRCAANACVEVAIAGDTILIRDTKRQDGTVLAYSREEWRVFVDGVKNGEFDLH
jgi:hypothetical protein